MSIEDTWLWKKAFAEPRGDSTEKEQKFFSERLMGMREKADVLVTRIAQDMPAMTVHDISHLDALWEMASILCKDQVQLNPPEAFVFGGAVLLHDAAMTLSAYSGGIDELRKTTEWKDCAARLEALSQEQGLELDATLKSELETLATEEALRNQHAVQAEKLPFLSWTTGNSAEEFLIDDAAVRNFYGERIGRIAHSHWWPIGQVAEDLNDLGPLGGKTTNRIDSVKIACLLRTADAIHLDSRRAPSFLRKVMNPAGFSALHWEFQDRMAAPFVEGTELVFSCSRPFEKEHAAAWWLAYDALEMVDSELRGVDRLFEKCGIQRLNGRRVRGCSSPTDLSDHIRTSGWEPVDTQIRVSDVPKIVATLGGNQLYGDEPTVAIRELVQNAADAIRARRKLEGRPDDWGLIKVELTRRDEELWLAVEDCGVGMSEAVLTGPLIDFGASFWRSRLASKEFPGLQSSGLLATGKFGIGFFSVFMLGSHVRVTSRRYDKATNSAKVLEFSKGLNLRPLLYDPEAETVPLDGGTRVEVKLEIKVNKAGTDPNPRASFDPNLLARLMRGRDPLSRENFANVIFSNDPLSSLVAALAPSLDVSIQVKKLEVEAVLAVEAGDWLELDESLLDYRVKGSEIPENVKLIGNKTRLRPLTEADGRVVGRAKIDPSSHFEDTGCITVGGFRASGLAGIHGILLGSATVASRNTASPIVNLQEVRRWASEQAELLLESNLTGESKAECAAIILWLGGDVLQLPIVRWNGAWLSFDELMDRVASADRVVVVSEDEMHQQDHDEVGQDQFENLLVESENVLFSVAAPSHRILDCLIELGFTQPAAIVESKVSDAIHAAWCGQVMKSFGVEEVGTVEFVDINRDATIFERKQSEAAD